MEKKVLSKDMKGNDLCLLCPHSVTDMVRLSVSNLNINAALKSFIGVSHEDSHALLFLQNLDPTKETPTLF